MKQIFSSSFLYTQQMNVSFTKYLQLLFFGPSLYEVKILSFLKDVKHSCTFVLK